MQTQWSTPAIDGLGGTPSGGGPVAMPPGDVLVDGAVGGTEAESEGGPGEEEAHRSAVDAVDALLDQVELALTRLDDGTYGRCQECGTPIDDARLAASPMIRTCGACVIGDGGTAAMPAPTVDTPGALSGAGVPAGPGGPWAE